MKLHYLTQEQFIAPEAHMSIQIRFSMSAFGDYASIRFTTNSLRPGASFVEGPVLSAN